MASTNHLHMIIFTRLSLTFFLFSFTFFACVCRGEPGNKGVESWLVSSVFSCILDRKFADIGNTVQLQYTSPTLHLSLGWAELVTSHALPGPGVIDGLKSVASAGSGGVLVIEMSTQDALTSPDYVKGLRC